MNPSNPLILLLGCDPQLPALLDAHLTAMGFRLCVEPEPDRYDPFSTWNDMAIVGPRLDPQKRKTLIRALKVQDPLTPILVLAEAKLGPEDGTDNRFEGVQTLSSASPEVISEAFKKAWAQRKESLAKSEIPLLVGRSRQMNEIRRRIEAVSSKDITVLITGETGTGKELVARSIHTFSQRHKGPLVKISCGNLPDQLLESEVFGFQKGAFTDASRNKPGRLELADKGTLFLDEIGDLSLNLQVKFLQVFEDQSFARLGAVDERAVDARVVAATNQDLSKKVREGGFRQDLFYRLNVVHIKTPPLRERREDIPLLIDYFLNRYCALLKRGGMDVPGKVIDLLMSYHWPGNVREMENLVRRGIVLQNWDFLGNEIRLQDVPEHFDPQPAPWLQNPLAKYFETGISSLRQITEDYVSEVERRSILNALKTTQWNRRKAAQLLNVSYKTVCTRIKELGLEKG